MKRINYQPAALKALRKMPANTSRRLRQKVKAFAENPASQANNVKSMKGSSAVRLRVGDWRVIMIDGEVLDVLEVGPRGSIYD